MSSATDSFTGTVREVVSWLMNREPDEEFEVTKPKKRRSRTQNAYYWVMLGQLARKLRVSNDEVHMQMLRQYGTFDVVLLRADVKASDYFEYFDERDAGFIKGQPYRQVTVYKRSSRMDSAEFSALIDGMRWECEQQGIDVLTPEEIARLRFVEPDKEEQ